MLICVIVAVAVAGGGVAAFAGWTVSTTSEPFTVHAARIPSPARPTVTVRGVPRIAWKPVAIAPDVDVHRYVVTRHLGPVAQVVCSVPATRTGCVDVQAPPGYPATYTVAATYGSHWVAESRHSRAVTRPGVAVPIIVEGVAVRPGSAGRPVVTDDLEGAEPSLGPPVSAGPVVPPVVVPPVPPAPGASGPDLGSGSPTGPTAPASENGPQPRPVDACPTTPRVTERGHAVRRRSEC